MQSLAAKLGFSSSYENSTYVPVAGALASLAIQCSALKNIYKEWDSESKTLSIKEHLSLASYNIVNIGTLGGFGALFGLYKLVAQAIEPRLSQSSKTEVPKKSLTPKEFYDGFDDNALISYIQNNAASFRIGDRIIQQYLTSNFETYQYCVQRFGKTHPNLSKIFYSLDRILFPSLKGQKSMEEFLEQYNEALIEAFIKAKNTSVFCPNECRAQDSLVFARLVCKKYPENAMLKGCFSQDIQRQLDEEI